MWFSHRFALGVAADKNWGLGWITKAILHTGTRITNSRWFRSRWLCWMLIGLCTWTMINSQHLITKRSRGHLLTHCLTWMFHFQFGTNATNLRFIEGFCTLHTQYLQFRVSWYCWHLSADCISYWCTFWRQCEGAPAHSERESLRGTRPLQMRSNANKSVNSYSLTLFSVRCGPSPLSSQEEGN